MYVRLKPADSPVNKILYPVGKLGYFTGNRQRRERLTMADTAHTLSHKLILSHLVEGEPKPGTEVRLKADQVLLQDALSTLSMLALEAIGLDRIKVDIACQYIDHNLLQTDYKNPDDHIFLQSAARRLGVHYSRPGNGISHPVHMERIGKPGTFLVGCDSHTPAAGSLGMLAIGAGSVDVATVMAGEPLAIRMPEIWGVKLTGALPPWVSVSLPPKTGPSMLEFTGGLVWR